MHWVCSSHARTWCLPSLCFFLLSSSVCPHYFPRRFCFDFHVLYVILPFCMLFMPLCVCVCVFEALHVNYALPYTWLSAPSQLDRTFICCRCPHVFCSERGPAAGIWNLSMALSLPWVHGFIYEVHFVLLMWGGLSVAVWLSEIPGESLYNMASCDVTMVSSG